MAIAYTAKATVTGGRTGTAKTDDGKLNFTMAAPGSSSGTNPEELFALGYAACFSGAVQHIAKLAGTDTGPVEVKIAVDLHKDDNGPSLGVTLDVALDVPGAKKFVEDAHAFCPYSRATRNNIPVVLKLNGETI